MILMGGDAIFNLPCENHYKFSCIIFLITILHRIREREQFIFYSCLFSRWKSISAFLFWEIAWHWKKNLNIKWMHIWILKICIWINIFLHALGIIMQRVIETVENKESIRRVYFECANREIFNVITMFHRWTYVESWIALWKVMEMEKVQWSVMYKNLENKRERKSPFSLSLSILVFLE